MIVIWAVGNLFRLMNSFQVPCNHLISICYIFSPHPQKVTGETSREGCKQRGQRGTEIFQGLQESLRMKRLPGKRALLLHGAEILQQAALLFHPLNNSGDCFTTTIRSATIIVIEWGSNILLKTTFFNDWDSNPDCGCLVSDAVLLFASQKK